MMGRSQFFENQERGIKTLAIGSHKRQQHQSELYANTKEKIRNNDSSITEFDFTKFSHLRYLSIHDELQDLLGKEHIKTLIYVISRKNVDFNLLKQHLIHEKSPITSLKLVFNDSWTVFDTNLSEILKHPTCKLTTLDISEMDSFTENFVNNMIDGLKNNHSVTQLVINTGKLDLNAKQKLEEVVADKKSLEIITPPSISNSNA